MFAACRRWPWPSPRRRSPAPVRRRGGRVPRPFPDARRPGRPGPRRPALRRPAPRPPVRQVPETARSSTATRSSARRSSLRGVPYRNGGDRLRTASTAAASRSTSSRSTASRCRARCAISFGSGKPVKPDELAPGDLLFFTTVGAGRLARGDRHRRRSVRPRAELDRRRPRRAPQRELLGARFLGARRVNRLTDCRTLRPSQSDLRGSEPALADEPPRHAAWRTGGCGDRPRCSASAAAGARSGSIRTPAASGSARQLRRRAARCSAAGTTGTSGSSSPTTPPMPALERLRNRGGGSRRPPDPAASRDRSCTMSATCSKKRVAVAVGRVGAVLALDPPDAGVLGIDVIQLVDDRVELGDPRLGVRDRSAPCASDRATDRRSAAARTRSGTSSGASPIVTTGDLVTNHSERRVILAGRRDRARSSSRARSAEG